MLYLGVVKTADAPRRKFALFNNNFQQAMGASGSIFAFLDDKDDVKEKPHAVSLRRFQSSVQFENVGFSYSTEEGEHQILHNVNLAVNANEVLAFQADGELVWIITAKQRYIATQNLRTIEQRLQNTTFRRIHRNSLVNVEQIRKMSVLTSQRWLITLNNGQEFIVSKRQAKNVHDVLSW